MEKKKYVIFSQHLAGWLMMQGFVLLGIERTVKNDKYKNVFLFNETISLHNAISNYKNLQQKSSSGRSF